MGKAYCEDAKSGTKSGTKSTYYLAIKSRSMTDPATINGLVAVAMTALGLLLGLIFWLKKSGKK